MRPLVYTGTPLLPLADSKLIILFLDSTLYTARTLRAGIRAGVKQLYERSLDLDATRAELREKYRLLTVKILKVRYERPALKEF